MKTLLLYDTVTPVTRQAHGKLSLKMPTSYEFARQTNSVPLVVAEFMAAAGDYAIVFTDTKEGIVPAAILGARDGENVYVGKKGEWDAAYIPAFVRRYPFVFAADDKAETFTLMMDSDYSGFNSDGKGERLFDSEGTQTAFIDSTMNFLKEYQALFNLTRAFGQKLNDLGLLEQGEARLPLPQDPERRLNGFKMVNRDKLKALAPDVLAGLLKTDELEMIYLHLSSLRNLDRVRQKMAAAPAVKKTETVQ